MCPFFNSNKVQAPNAPIFDERLLLDMSLFSKKYSKILPVVIYSTGSKMFQTAMCLRQADAILNRLLSGNTLLNAHHLSQALNRHAGSDANI